MARTHTANAHHVGCVVVAFSLDDHWASAESFSQSPTSRFALTALRTITKFLAPRQQHPSIPLRTMCTSCDHGEPSVLGLVPERRVEPRIAEEIGRVRKLQKRVTPRHLVHMAAGHEVQMSCSEITQLRPRFWREDPRRLAVRVDRAVQCHTSVPQHDPVGFSMFPTVG